MDPSLFDASFPPLSTHLQPSSSTNPFSSRNWNKILTGSPSPCDFQISSLPTPEETIPFPHEDIVDASDEWNLALVGYSLGKRPYYETLLGAIRKHWKLKGAWFLLGKPFVFQKWTPHFSPNREEFTSVPIWFKIHDLPLCCWTPVGISKIATKIGEPLTVDALTASKSRLTYARVCVLVDSAAKYPDTVPISVEGKIFKLKIEYEWRPTVCSFCMSLNHSPSVCPSNPNPEIRPPAAPSRGRSISRRNRPQSNNQKGLIPIPPKEPILLNPLSKLTNLPPLDTEKQDIKVLAKAPNPIINLMSCPSIGSWNIRGFNTSDKIISAKNLAAREKLDMLCILENRILPENMSDPWFSSSHRVFENEVSYHNFDKASPGRIWIKWDPEKISFSPLQSSKQYVTGITSAQGSQPCLLSVIYASNSFSERNSLWDDLRSQDPGDSMPWIIIGDFNCCRFQSEKSGGNAIPASKLAPFNEFIFDSKVMEIPSTGIFLTWYNQRTVNPIFIRLDRMLANDAWFRAFPNSSYKVLNSNISDHTPLILNSGNELKLLPRFMYKNFWTKFSKFWTHLVTVFDEPYLGNPISWFYRRLKQLKLLIKREDWASSNLILAKCKNLEGQQLNCQIALDNDLNNGEICNRLKLINRGLGIASLKATRYALNCAAICRFYNYHTPFSVWLRTRYSSPWKPPDPADSPLWKDICRTAACVKGNFKFTINDKSTASIIWDHWCMGDNLSNLFPEFCHNSAALLKWDPVKNWSHNSVWILPNYIDPIIANELKTTLTSIPILTNVSSHVVWKDNNKSNYKDFYNDFFEREETVAWHKFVWHKSKALRFSVFTWQAILGGLKTVDALARRNIHSSEPHCTFCSCELETLSHLFFECPYSFTVLIKLIPSFQSFYLRPSLLQALNHVGNLPEDTLDKQGLLLTLNAIVYHLWRERNNRRYGSSTACAITTVRKVAKVIKYKLSHRKFSEFFEKWLTLWLMDHPQFLSNPLYIAGDSYAGKVVPLVVHNILNGNDLEEQQKFNIQGYIIGNPSTCEFIDRNAQVPFAFGMGIISDELYQGIDKNCEGEDYNNPKNSSCASLIQIFEEVSIHFKSEITMNQILEPHCSFATPKPKYVASTRKSMLLQESYTALFGPPIPEVKCRTYAYYLMNIWGNSNDVQEALNVKKCLRAYPPNLIGYTESYSNNMTFATVKGAGHTAPEYKAKECLAMFRRWISHRLL
ncbi:hypothetical protein M5K25_008255 [Dendrobium thyrsiflorum]|uniref:Uncharacterized protein n=1 Tax=Dendrobium thyrsiflorum TaxID=117978 RepID=A0ABD0V9B9_DENTH